MNIFGDTVKENEGHMSDQQEAGETLLDDVGGPDVITKSLKGRRGKQRMSVIGQVLLVALGAVRMQESGCEAGDADSRKSQGQILPSNLQKKHSPANTLILAK